MCLTPDTKIYTENGLKIIKDFEVGDRVLTHTGNYNKITKIFNRNVNENIYSIKIQGITDRINITEEHPILLCSNKRELYHTGDRYKLSSLRNNKIELKWIPSKDEKKEILFRFQYQLKTIILAFLIQTYVG